MKKGPFIIVLVGLTLLAFLYFSPVTPPQNETGMTENEETEQEATIDPDQEVDEALHQLQSGEAPPMEAILRISKVAEDFPDNVKANFTLGVLSMQTGQYEKAIERFQTVTRVQPDNPDAWRLLSEAHLRTGDTATAKMNFEKALQLADDEKGETFKEELPELSIN